LQGIINLQQLFSAKRSKAVSDTQNKNTVDPILIEISSVLEQIKNSKNRFDYETEYDMIDACIYEEQALLARYSHLLSIARQKGITCTPTQNRMVSEQGV